MSENPTPVLDNSILETSLKNPHSLRLGDSLREAPLKPEESPDFTIIEAKHRLQESLPTFFSDSETVRKIIWFPPSHTDVFNAYHLGECFELGFAKPDSVRGFNSFEKWTRTPEPTFEISDISLMNCIDFVYLMFLKAGLMTKQEIKRRYDLDLRGGDEYLLGIKEDAFTDFDDSDPSCGIGDILIGYAGERFAHMAILSRKNELGEWNIFELSRGSDNPSDGSSSPREIALKDMLALFASYHGPLRLCRYPLAKTINITS
jgi:hypothetical protein